MPDVLSQPSYKALGYRFLRLDGPGSSVEAAMQLTDNAAQFMGGIGT